MKLFNLKMGLKKVLKSKIGGVNISKDEEYERIIKFLEKEKKALSRRKRHLSSFFNHFQSLLGGIRALIDNLRKVYQISSVEERDPLLESLNEISKIVVECVKDYKDLREGLLKVFFSTIEEINKTYAGLKSFQQQRENVKLNYDTVNSSVKSLAKKLKKAQATKDPKVGRVKEKYDVAKKKLRKTVEEYNKINTSVKERLLNVMNGSKTESVRMVLQITDNMLLFSKDLFLNFVNIVGILNTYKKEEVSKQRAVLQISNICCHILEDTKEISTFVQDKIYVGSVTSVLKTKKKKQVQGAVFTSDDDDENIVKIYGIRTIIDLSGEPKESLNALDFGDEEEVTCHSFSFSQDYVKGFSNNTDTFEKIFRILDDELAHPIFLTCFGGVSDSGFLLIAYIMKTYKKRLLDSFLFLQNRRRFIYPCEGYVIQLQKYERKLFPNLNKTSAEGGQTGNDGGPSEMGKIRLPKPKDVYAQRWLELYQGEGFDDISHGKLEAENEYKSTAPKKKITVDEIANVSSTSSKILEEQEEEIKKMEEDSRRKEIDLIRKKEKLKKKEVELDMQEQLRRKEEELKKKEGELRMKEMVLRKQEELRKMELELKKKEEMLKKKEMELMKKGEGGKKVRPPRPQPSKKGRPRISKLEISQLRETRKKIYLIKNEIKGYPIPTTQPQVIHPRHRGMEKQEKIDINSVPNPIQPKVSTPPVQSIREKFEKKKIMGKRGDSQRPTRPKTTNAGQTSTAKQPTVMRKMQQKHKGGPTKSEDDKKERGIFKSKPVSSVRDRFERGNTSIAKFVKRPMTTGNVGRQSNKKPNKVRFNKGNNQKGNVNQKKEGGDVLQEKGIFKTKPVSSVRDIFDKKKTQPSTSNQRRDPKIRKSPSQSDVNRLQEPPKRTTSKKQQPDGGEGDEDEKERMKRERGIFNSKPVSSIRDRFEKGKF